MLRSRSPLRIRTRNGPPLPSRHSRERTRERRPPHDNHDRRTTRDKRSRRSRSRSSRRRKKRSRSKPKPPRGHRNRPIVINDRSPPPRGRDRDRGHPSRRPPPPRGEEIEFVDERGNPIPKDAVFLDHRGRAMMDTGFRKEDPQYGRDRRRREPERHDRRERDRRRPPDRRPAPRLAGGIPADRDRGHTLPEPPLPISRSKASRFESTPDAYELLHDCAAWMEEQQVMAYIPAPKEFNIGIDFYMPCESLTGLLFKCLSNVDSKYLFQILWPCVRKAILEYHPQFSRSRGKKKQKVNLIRKLSTCVMFETWLQSMLERKSDQIPEDPVEELRANNKTLFREFRDILDIDRHDWDKMRKSSPIEQVIYLQYRCRVARFHLDNTFNDMDFSSISLMFRYLNSL